MTGQLSDLAGFTFAIYALRADPDCMIFDVDAGSPLIGERLEYDCNMNRRTGELENFFSPRYAMPESVTA